MWSSSAAPIEQTLRYRSEPLFYTTSLPVDPELTIAACEFLHLKKYMLLKTFLKYNSL